MKSKHSQGYRYNNDQIPDFENGSTQKTQQFLCASNSKVNGPGTMKAKKQAWQPTCSSHLNEWTQKVREQNTKAQEKNKN